jgi:cysteinyl-tRNA synthetase
MTWRLLVLVVGLVSLAAPLTIAAPVSRVDTPQLSAVAHWLYLLDVNLSVETVGQIATSDYDLVVLDYVPSERDNTAYPMAETIRRLQTAQTPKLVLAYIDIGQAENYRTYWQRTWRVGSPDWITGDDPDGWTGNHPVAFWRDAWRQIWLGDDGYLGGIVAAGFDGVYLDWIEAYSDPNVVAMARKEGRDARGAMLDWVEEIARFGRDRKAGFLVVGNVARVLAASRALGFVPFVSGRALDTYVPPQ